MSLRHRARPRKLNPKAALQCFRFDQVNIDAEDDSARLTEIDNGVDKGEREEYHLQQAIKASQAAAAEASKLKDAYIPTPPIINSNVDYDALYHKGWRQPTSYIRSSSTVEDCAGTPYNMDEEDEIALKQINVQLSDGVKECSEDQFEDVMAFFEETAQNKQPFAAVDSPPVLPLEELEEQYDSTVPGHVRLYAKFIYEHWKSRRTATGNRPITAQLKNETGADTDDADPYVCFRRREARQVRKTRNRDAHSAEKLRTLRRQLEDARNLLILVKRREVQRREILETDFKIFKQRAEVKETKRKLGIKGDDEDLVNQKKRKEVHGISPGNAQQLAQMRSLIGRGGPADELRSLEAVQENRDREIGKEIQLNIEKHINWNKGYVDKTRAPLSPPESDMNFADRDKEYRKAMPVQIPLPTPPASVSDGEGENMEMTDGETVRPRDTKPLVELASIRYSSPDPGAPPAPSFRTRVGRGGRIVLDRRLPFRPMEHHPFQKLGRNKFDSDDEDADNVESDDDPDHDFDRCMVQRQFLFGKAQQNMNPARQIEGPAGLHRSPSSQVNGMQQPAGT